jgi:hypothetical protein
MALGVFRLVQSLLAIDPIGTDFHGFYAAGWSLRTGQPWPGDIPNPNFNPPTFELLMVALSWLTIRAAYLTWSAIGLLAVAATLRAVHRRCPIPSTSWPWVIGALGLTAPAIQTWSHGQIAWLLLYPITRAWLTSSPFRAGLWLAPAIAIALFLPSTTWVVAGAVSATMTALHVAIAGLGPWQAWLERSLAAPGLRQPANASFFGVATRLQFGTVFDLRPEAPIAALPWGWWALWLACAGGAIVLARRTSGPRRWIVALTAGTWLQPLGWTYYLVFWLGPMLRDGRRSAWTIAAGVVLTEPLLIAASIVTRDTPLFFWSLSACAIGLWCLAIGLWRVDDQRAHGNT